MKGGTSLIAVLLLAAQLSYGQTNVCERIFDYSNTQEYLPFPLVSDGLVETQAREIETLYVPAIGLAFEIRQRPVDPSSVWWPWQTSRPDPQFFPGRNSEGAAY